MKKTLTTLSVFFLLAALFNCIYSQEETSTTSSEDDSLKTGELDPVKAQIVSIIKEVNTRFKSIDNIISSGEIKVKTPKIDESGSIEIHAKKKNDLWFLIEGPMGVDVAQAHFNRKRFVFLDDLNDELITGSTTIINIGTLTKIRCTFDDLLNSFTGTVRIPKGKKDSLWLEDETSQYVVALKRGTITRKYWVDKLNYTVTKYAYYNKRGQILIQFEFSNFSTHGDASYAKRIEVRRPLKGEYFRLSLESVSLNQSYVSFTVDYPSDVKRKNWK
jgi:Domain of unknown function (DUF4292)